MKPARSILDNAFVYTNAAKTDVTKTFERARQELRAKEIARCECSAAEWWKCSERGCMKEAEKRYGEQVVRFEPRSDHDQDTQGRKLKAGK